MSDFIGHANVLDLLDRLKSSGRLGSALLLVGPSGIGKRKIADWVVGATIGNPDVMIVERELNDKDELKKNISIDQVRDLIARLSMSSFSGGRKVGIIDGAETLSTEAANALLKTLEDPTGDVFVILLATSIATIPATVLSRSQVLHLPLVSNEAIESALVERGASSADAREIAQFACGRPGVALRLLADPAYRASLEMYQRELDAFLSASLAEKFGLIAALGKGERAEFDARLDVWEVALHRKHLYQPLKRLMSARKAIEQNVNPLLALEHSFI